MARTNLPLTTLTQDGGAVAPATTAVDVANGMNIALASSAIPAGPNPLSLVIVFNQTFAGAKNIIIRAGANPPSFRKDKGDLQVSANAQVAYVGPFDPARYLQTDGSLNVDFDAGTTGTVLALLLPHPS